MFFFPQQSKAFRGSSGVCSGVWGGFWGVGRLEEGSALRGFHAQVARRVQTRLGGRLRGRFRRSFRQRFRQVAGGRVQGMFWAGLKEVSERRRFQIKLWKVLDKVEYGRSAKMKFVSNKPFSLLGISPELFLGAFHQIRFR